MPIRVALVGLTLAALFAGCGGGDPATDAGADAALPSDGGSRDSGRDAARPDDAAVTDDAAVAGDAGPPDGGALDAFVCPDADSDGVCDDDDVCAIGADTIDGDADTVPDACDVCDPGDDTVDADGDSVPDTCDACAAGDDAEDADGDSVPDACDVCATGSDRIDDDADETPDACDLCPDQDDRMDTDGDGVPNGCDECATGPDMSDADLDGVPNACDICPGFSDRDDGDSDLVPNGCDRCAGGDDRADADADTTPDACDRCAGVDDRAAPTFRSGGFASTTGWTARGGATIDTAGAGASSPGFARFPADPLCVPRVEQRVCMPAAEIPTAPLVIRYATTQPACRDCGTQLTASGVTVIRRQSTSAGFGTIAQCVGEAWYGSGFRSFAFSSGNQLCSTVGFGDPPVAVSIDDVSIATVTTDVCPAIGTVLNGRFDRGLVGWTLTGMGMMTNELEGANTVMRLRTNGSVCDAPIAAADVSIPLDETLPQAAVRFRWKGTLIDGPGHFAMMRATLTGGPNVTVAITHRSPAPAAFTAAQLCVPASMVGTVARLTVSVQAGTPAGGGSATCSDIAIRDIRLDDFEVVSDPVGCP